MSKAHRRQAVSLVGCGTPGDTVCGEVAGLMAEAKARFDAGHDDAAAATYRKAIETMGRHVEGAPLVVFGPGGPGGPAGADDGTRG